MEKKEYLFLHQADLRHYQAEAFTLRCFDDRFWPSFKKFLKQKGIKHFDPASVAGGAKILASPEKESDRDFILRELQKSIRLHHTKRVMLFSHHDCGAYGGFSKFDNDEGKEFDSHCQELRAARKIILNKFPQLVIEIFFIDDQGVARVI